YTDIVHARIPRRVAQRRPAAGRVPAIDAALAPRHAGDMLPARGKAQVRRRHRHHVYPARLVQEPGNAKPLRVGAAVRAIAGGAGVGVGGTDLALDLAAAAAEWNASWPCHFSPSQRNPG